jgi:hypothetical protein
VKSHTSSDFRCRMQTCIASIRNVRSWIKDLGILRCDANTLQHRHLFGDSVVYALKRQHESMMTTASRIVCWCSPHMVQVHSRMSASQIPAALQRQRRHERADAPADSASKRLLMVLNAGCSSLKFKLHDAACGSLHPKVTGLVERIGDTAASRMIVKTPLGDRPGRKIDTIDPGFQVC